MINRFFLLNRILIIVFIIFLFIANIYLFSQSLFLSEKLYSIEERIKKLTLENENYRKKLYRLNSLEYIISVENILGFTERVKPISITEYQYARKP